MMSPLLELTAGIEVDRSGSTSEECVDGVFNYAANLMTMALIEKDFKDASREMDGPRLFRLWKLKMLFFKDAAWSHQIRLRRTVLSGRSICRTKCSTGPIDNYGIVVSIQKGGKGNNIALDLMVEHLNNYVKDKVSHQGANFSFKSALVASRSALATEDIMTYIDRELRIKPESGEHTMASI